MMRIHFRISSPVVRRHFEIRKTSPAFDMRAVRVLPSLKYSMTSLASSMFLMIPD